MSKVYEINYVDYSGILGLFLFENGLDVSFKNSSLFSKFYEDWIDFLEKLFILF